MAIKEHSRHRRIRCYEYNYPNIRNLPAPASDFSHIPQRIIIGPKTSFFWRSFASSQLLAPLTRGESKGGSNAWGWEFPKQICIGISQCRCIKKREDKGRSSSSAPELQSTPYSAFNSSTYLSAINAATVPSLTAVVICLRSFLLRPLPQTLRAWKSWCPRLQSHTPICLSRPALSGTRSWGPSLRR